VCQKKKKSIFFKKNEKEKKDRKCVDLPYCSVYVAAAAMLRQQNGEKKKESPFILSDCLQPTLLDLLALYAY